MKNDNNAIYETGSKMEEVIPMTCNTKINKSTFISIMGGK